MQRVVVLKDQVNKRAHADSAQLACEAAGAIRTVASLTREEDSCRLYGQSLEETLRRSNRTALWSNALYAFSQSLAFFVIALVFWYGSVLVSRLEYSIFQFLVGLMVSLHIRAYFVAVAYGDLTGHNIWGLPSWQCLRVCSGRVFGEGCSIRYCQAARFHSRNRRRIQ